MKYKVLSIKLPSSDADTLPERILALWVGLYEHDYLGEQDVHAAREWLNALTASGYKFPSVVINSHFKYVKGESKIMASEENAALAF